MLTFPIIDPVAIHLGPLAVRWYALAYVVGIVLGTRYAIFLASQNPQGPNKILYDDFITYAVLGIILGGRIGYVLFYNFDYYFHNPLDALMVWHGGMAFHGGLIGVITAIFVFTRIKKISFFAFSDILACATPIGLFFGRIANFINGELYGRVSDAPWAMVFPHGGDLPRHPSQLYHAALEGLCLFLIMAVLAQNKKLRARTGFLSGAFLSGYALFRGFVEFFREPDMQIGFLWGGITMGQVLCVPMLLAGLWLMLRRHPEKNTA
jgi:phosphatidylglycerol:prolipoprotein diacylglycerol transferase